MIYPTTTTGVLNFSKSLASLVEEGFTTIVMTDLSGKTIFSESISRLRGIDQLDISKVESGQYILNITGGDNVYQTTIIKN